MREVDKIQHCQARMTQTLEQVNYQLGVNKECRHQLERDLANKDHGINIDHTVHQLRNTSRAINLHGGIEKVKKCITYPISKTDLLSWIQMSAFQNHGWILVTGIFKLLKV